RTPSDEALKVLSGLLPSSLPLAHAWARAQGPIVRPLIDRLPAEAGERDLLVFFQLLSHPTFVGMPLVAAHSALVPLVHEERPIYTTLAGRTLTLPRVLLVNTNAEAARIARVASGPLAAMERTGVGLETPATPSPTFVPPTPYPYLVVMGRQGKARPLPAVWRALSSATRLPPLEIHGTSVRWTDVRLVTVGELSRLYDGLPNVVHAGYVGDSERWDILRGALALVNPSLYESLSLVLLEAWTVARPVVVHRQCDVTTEHVRESGGGIAVDFARPDEAAAAIANGLRGESDRDAMGHLGAAHAERSFSWDRVLDIYERVALDARRHHALTASAGA
ncbi:MAG TPA: glycosyltransferase family 4 protein, partial [Vicinamibacterales bacterium]|nr:glycosyltransferase family 4 protein [Vicinamibacterales bacterium]